MATKQLEDLSGAQLLDEVDALHKTQRETGARILQAAVQFAVIHNGSTVDPIAAKHPGREQAVQLGGEGTPLVAEFAPAILAARLQISPYAGAALIGDALDLHHRLPRLWKRVQALEIRDTHARFVARKTRGLTPSQAATVDAAVAPYADGSLCWTRFEDLVHAKVIAADRVTAAEREAEAARRTFAKATRSTDHGMRGFYLRADFATIARIDATVAYLAQALQALGDNSSLDERRVLAMLILANPVQAVELLQAYATWRSGHEYPDVTTDPTPFDPSAAVTVDETFEVDPAKLLPTIVLYVHLAGDADQPGVARVEDLGPVSPDWVRTHLGPRCRFKITPVLDPLHQTPVDSYEVPHRHRQAVRILTPADVFPYAANTSGTLQIDHTDPYDHGPGAPPGQSRVGNYGPMTGFHHRIKTHAGWQVQQPFPGIYLWRDPTASTTSSTTPAPDALARPPNHSLPWKPPSSLS